MGNISSYSKISENGKLVYINNTYQLWSGSSFAQYTVPGVDFTGVSGDGRILSVTRDYSTTPPAFIFY